MRVQIQGKSDKIESDDSFILFNSPLVEMIPKYAVLLWQQEQHIV